MVEKDARREAPAEPNAETATEQTLGDQSDLQQQLEDAKLKAEENWNNFLRARAEIDNTRRRAERDLEQAHKYALEKFATELLPVKDSLELGVTAAREPGADVNKLREGAELTLKLLTQAFERFKLVEVDPRGERFDPARHEAVATQESADQEPNTVMHVVQKGYLINDRLLRPAMVVVARGPAQDAGGRIDDQA
jgi:molecular chaperone GrpE